jgi:selenocysteine-specific elongation factor
MKHLIIGTAGHVDHGKTSLIKALTNIDCDTHKEEKARGITINLGFSHLELPNGESLGIVDVPGHKDFINTMVGGASGIDMVLLVIAADSGIMPQTVEHINIITSLGISKGIVALTKIDLVDDELAEIAEDEISSYLQKTSLKGAPIVGVSSITGKGKDDLIAAIQNIAMQIEEKEIGSFFRMFIDRIFTVKGFGSVVTGSVLDGSIEVGKDVLLLPGNCPKLRVRSIERHGKAVDRVVAGDRAAINLIGLKNEDFNRGMIISDKQLKETQMIDATISLFDIGEPIPIWSNISFISGTYESQARMHIINMDVLQPNEEAIVQIHLNKPAILLSKDKFIFRNTSSDLTLGGGCIIDASPLHHKKRTPKLIEYLTSLVNSIQSVNSTKEIIGIELKKELRPFSPDEIADNLNITVEDLKGVIKERISGYIVYQSGDNDILIDSSHDKSFAEKVLKILSEHHAKNPILPNGLDSKEIIGKLGLAVYKTGKLYMELLLSKMKTEGFIETAQNTWILKGHKPKLDKQTQEEIQWFENEIIKCDTEKPVLSEIEERAAGNRIQKNKLKLYLSYLAGDGKIQFYQSDFLHTSIINRFRPILLKKLSQQPNGIDIPEYKELIGGTKRFRALLTDIFEAEKIISLSKGTETETRIQITQTGKKLFNEGLSR